MAEGDSEQDSSADLSKEMEVWQQGHPHAGWAEIEQAMQERLDRLRRQAWVMMCRQPGTGPSLPPWCGNSENSVR